MSGFSVAKNPPARKGSENSLRKLASGSVTEGKRYYLKANLFPGFLAAHVALGIAERTDQRIQEWDELKATAPLENARAKFESTKQLSVQHRIQDFRNGAVKSFAKITDEQAF